MRINVLKLLLLLFTAIALSGCFEIIEDVSFNEDGSGKFKVIVNYSMSKSQLTKIMSQDSIAGQKIPSKEEIKGNIQKVVALLESQEGISNVVYSTDFENFIFKASFDFKNSDALNIAVANIIKSQDPKAVTNPVTYSWVNKTVNRTFHSGLLNQAKQNKEKVTKYLGGFENAKLTTIFRFQNEITTGQELKGKISTSKKNYFQQSSVNKILDFSSYQTIQVKTK